MKRLSVNKTIQILKGILKLHTTSAVISELRWVDKHAYNTNGKSDTLDDLIIYYDLNPHDEKLNHQQKLDLVAWLPLSKVQKETHMCLHQATATRSQMTDTDNYQYWATRNTLMSYIYDDTRNAINDNIGKLEHDTQLIEQVFDTVHDKKSLHLMKKIEHYYKFYSHRNNCSHDYNDMILNQIQPRINYYINQICGWEINVQLDSEVKEAFKPLDKDIIKQQFKKANA